MTNADTHFDRSAFDIPTAAGPELQAAMHPSASALKSNDDAKAEDDSKAEPGATLGSPAEHWLGRDAVGANERELAADAVRVNLRYQVELIEAFNLCPWAKGARTTDNAVPLVDDGNSLLEQVARAATLGADVVFLILPTYVGGRFAFEELVARLIAEDARSRRDSSPPFAMAAFHPQPTFEASHELTPETLVAFLRRSPDPTIQLIRLAALANVRKWEAPGTSFIDPSQIDFAALAKSPPQRPSLRQRVSNANHSTYVSAAGAQLRQVLEEILTDRKQSRQRLGLPLAPWEVS